MADTIEQIELADASVTGREKWCKTGAHGPSGRAAVRMWVNLRLSWPASFLDLLQEALVDSSEKIRVRNILAN